MKIQLERREKYLPDGLICVACQQKFTSGEIRALLYSDRNVIQGDLCPNCLQQKARELKKKIRERACLLLIRSSLALDKNPMIQERATELLQLAKESVQFPYPWQWWFKKMQIAAEEYSELETARLGLSSCSCRERQRLESLFEKGLND